VEDASRRRVGLVSAKRASVAPAVRDGIEGALALATVESCAVRIAPLEDVGQARPVVGKLFVEVFDRVFHAISILDRSSISQEMLVPVV